MKKLEVKVGTEIMNDSTYRTASSQEAPKEPVIENKTKGTVEVSSVEPPFTEYEKKNGKPYPVDYFDLGQYWNTGELYTKEIDSISTYLSHLIHTGEINNSLSSVKNKLKSIEKMINVHSDDRRAARVGKVAAYVEFLIKADNIKKDAAKYGMV